jgi:hypothetical protein
MQGDGEHTALTFQFLLSSSVPIPDNDHFNCLSIYLSIYHLSCILPHLKEMAWK